MTKRPRGTEAAPVRLRLRVKPNARRNAFEGTLDGRILVSIKAPPTDGRANAELIAFLAKAFGTAKSNVSIVSGAGSRDKRVEIHAPRRSPQIVDPGLEN